MNVTAMQASYEDARPFCPTPLIGGGAQKPKLEPVKVVATPYVWRDPTTIKPREWVYGRSIQRGHVRAILAPGAAGKTILSVGEALAMATGRNLLGQEVPGGPKRVWLWNLEDDAEELARIIQAACKHWSIGPEHIRDQPCPAQRQVRLVHDGIGQPRQRSERRRRQHGRGHPVVTTRRV